MVKTLGERIENRLKAIGKRKADLARACGVASASVSDWVNGASINLSAENLLLAADFLQCRPKWLLHGTGVVNLEPIAQVYELREPSRYYGDPAVGEAIKIMEQLDPDAKHEALSFLRLYSLKKATNHSNNISIPTAKGN
jgi:transcriptional regulator with XRE-family HTH domain